MAWRVVGPTGHTVAVYQHEEIARRVADQLGWDHCAWHPDTAGEPHQVPLTDRPDRSPQPSTHTPLSQVKTGSADTIQRVGEPSESAIEQGSTR